MSSDIPSPRQLAFFSPLDGMKRENIHALVRKTRIERCDADTVLFRQGDGEARTFYVLEGTVELRDGDDVMATVEGGSETARNPLAPTLPRRYTAVATSAVRYLSLDSEMLDVMLTWDQTGTYEVSELQPDGAEADDWMTTLLQTKAFHRIPPANIQAIFMRLKRVAYRAGEVVIKQGDEGDYFYVVTQGRCLVIRETPLNKEGIRLAELGIGDTFGEEALIFDARRNATVTMITDGTLMRLSKEDFRTLLNEPMLDWVDYDRARQIIADGGRWLDVRLPSEFENFHEEGALNLPLYSIRLKLKSLEAATPYVVCCDTGRRSSAGAFILNERGYTAYVLQGGLNAYRTD